MGGQTEPINADDFGAPGLSADQIAKPRLLVIDDDKLHRMIICRAATRAGYAPAGAASYEEAVELVQQSAFDCITLDLSLGQHAGIEVLHHLWNIGFRAPIIVISSSDCATCTETMELGRSIDLDICETMHKPVDLAVLHGYFERIKAARTAPTVG